MYSLPCVLAFQAHQAHPSHLCDPVEKSKHLIIHNISEDQSGT